MKEFTFKTIFASIQVKSLVSKSKDEYLASASLAEVGKFIPNVGEKNVDLLPVAFNACVINRVNKNTDVVDTKTALGFYKAFINKPINLEHDRKKVIGVILNAGFSKFQTDEPLTEDQVTKMTDPFNITLGGVIWRVVSPETSNLIEDSNDPTSENYQIISASWELGFAEYDIALLDAGKKNLAQASEIITNDTEIELAKKHLKALKGDGKYKDMFAYRMPRGEVLPLGIGFTEKPAAEVKGIATQDSLNQESNIINIPDKPTFASENQNKISQIENSDVKIERINIMPKINSIADITEDSLKQATAAQISDLISQEIVKGNATWLNEKNILNQKLAEAKSASDAATANSTELTKKLTEIQATVEVLQKEKSNREQVEKFNVRMATIAEQYELDDDTRAVIVEEIKSIASDEDFTKYTKKAAVLFKSFAKKGGTVSKPKDELDKPAKSVEKGKGVKSDPNGDSIDNPETRTNKAQQTKLAPNKHGKVPGAIADEDGEMDASKNKAQSAEAIAAVVDTSVDNADVEKGGLPNGSSLQEKSLAERYKDAFKLDKFVIRV